jgi:hypothetical protein
MSRYKIKLDTHNFCINTYREAFLSSLQAFKISHKSEKPSYEPEFISFWEDKACYDQLIHSQEGEPQFLINHSRLNLMTLFIKDYRRRNNMQLHRLSLLYEIHDL